MMLIFEVIVLVAQNNGGFNVGLTWNSWSPSYLCYNVEEPIALCDLVFQLHLHSLVFKLDTSITPHCLE